MVVGLLAPSRFAVPATSYSAEVLADSPLAYWRLGETSGTTAADSSGNSRNATYETTKTSTPGLLTGDANGGSAQTAYLGPAAWMNPTSITVECLWKPSGSNNNGGIVTRFEGTSQFILWVNTSSQIAWRPYSTSGGSVDIAWSTTPTTGNTYHIAATYTSGQARLYINGTQVAQSTALSGDLRVGNHNMLLKFYYAAGVFGVNGTLDEVAIYGSELSPARIAAHYAAA